MPTEILRRGAFKSEYDLLELDILDWNRLMGYWENTAEAVQAIASWLIDTSIYKVVRCDLTEAPEREDWPGWKHGGNHPEIGKRYWNWFHWKYNQEKQFHGELFFSDSPDFRGTLLVPGWPKASFYGDIGKVSPPTFIRTLKCMDAHDIWISIIDEYTQVSIEPVKSIRQLWTDYIDGLFK